MKLFAILSVILVLGSATESIDFFNMLASKDYGKTIIEAIQLELGQDGGNQKEIVVTLKGMLQDAEQEKSSIQSNLQKRQGICQARQSEAAEVIARASGKKADDEKKVPLKNEELLDKQKQSKDKDGEEQRNLDKIAAISELRAEEKKEYEEKRGELVGLIAALGEAKKIISSLAQPSSSFLQTSMEEHLNSFIESFPDQSGYTLMVQLMLKTANQIKLDGGAVEKIVEIIQGLAESLYEVQKDELMIDDQREANFQNQKARLQLAIKNLAAAIAHLQSLELRAEQEILELQNDINSQKQLIAVKTKELQDWVKTCNDEEKGFRSVYDSRTQQIEVLNEVISMFDRGLSAELQKQVAVIQLN